MSRGERKKGGTGVSDEGLTSLLGKKNKHDATRMTRLRAWIDRLKCPQLLGKVFDCMRVQGAADWRKLHTEELRDLYSSRKYSV